MRIGIDARYLKSDFTGIGVYSEGLLEALAVEDKDNEYIVVVHDSYKGSLALGPNFEIVTDHAVPVSLRTIATIHTLFRRYDVDAIHSLYPLAPLLWDGRLLATVHDLQPLLDPHFTGNRPRLQRWVYDMFYRFAYPATMRKANFLISDSFATKTALLDLFPEFSDKVLVVHGALGRESFDAPSDEEVNRIREKYGLPKRFIFYLGSTRPNKNLPNMLDAFETFLKQHPEHGDLQWVMVLKTDRFFDDLFARIRERNMLRHVQIHEQISETERNAFYRSAELLYFCTKFEGFGLPVLEAQANALPVLASTHSALPEVAGKGAILCDPDSPDSIFKGLELFYSGETARAELTNAGLSNVKRFSWQKAAKEVLDMYTHLLA